MRQIILTRQRDTSDVHIRVVFGSWAIVRSRSADAVEGWIDPATLGPSATDLGEIAAAIRQAGSQYARQTPTALAA
jgi:hypothetical protein